MKYETTETRIHKNDDPTYLTLARRSSFGNMSHARVQKVMTQPINLIFRFLQNVRPFVIGIDIDIVFTLVW